MKKTVPLLILILLFGCGGGGGSGSGSDVGFPPVVTLNAATVITENSAILNGSVIPNGWETQCWFEYGTDAALSTFDNSARQTMGAGVANQPVVYALNTLNAGTTYFYRICASSQQGASKSSITAFTTSLAGAPPFVSTQAATSVTTNGALLNGSVTPNGLSSNAWFEWGTDAALSIFSSTPTQTIGSGTTSLWVGVPLTGLSVGTTYYFRVAAANNAGAARGEIASFIPGLPPLTVTVAATAVTATGEATINGYVTPNGLPTNAWFEWGTDASLAGSSITPAHPVGSGTTSQLVSESLTGLSPGTTYYYRLSASNSSGTTSGTIFAFVAGMAPTAATQAATAISETGATLHGEVNPNGLGATACFIWGTDPLLIGASSTAVQDVGSGSSVISVNAALNGLLDGTTYYYRIVAESPAGTSGGSIMSFTTIAIGTVAEPTFSPNQELHIGIMNASIATTTPGASIRYTLDGSAPTSSTGELYVEPITINATTTIRAIAYLAAWKDSPVVTKTYTIGVATPAFTPGPGTYDSAVNVSLSTETADANIRYTLDGSTPSATNGTVYSGPIPISSSTLIKAYAFDAGMADSTVAYGSYTIIPQGTALFSVFVFYNDNVVIFVNNVKEIEFQSNANRIFPFTVPSGSVKAIYKMRSRGYQPFTIVDGNKNNVFQLPPGADLTFSSAGLNSMAEAWQSFFTYGNGYTASYQAPVNAGDTPAWTVTTEVTDNTIATPAGVGEVVYYQNGNLVSFLDPDMGTVNGTMNGDLLYFYWSGNIAGELVSFTEQVAVNPNGTEFSGTFEYFWDPLRYVRGTIQGAR